MSKEDWLNSKWRPAMGWMYMLVCTKDMVRSRLRAKGQKYIGVFDHLMANYIAKLEKSKNT